MEVNAYQVPFRHWVVEHWSGRDDALDQAFPPVDWPHWIPYSSPVEQKRTCEALDSIPPPLGAAISQLQSPSFLEWLGELTGVSGLQTDSGLRGGGLHVTDRDGYLDVHLDYKIHPTLNLERRLNAILFCNREWDDAWGGALELWDADGRAKVKEIYPRFGRLVVFECSDESYHGMPEPLRCPPFTCRKTIAVYYLTPPRGRRRALFVPRRRVG